MRIRLNAVPFLCLLAALTLVSPAARVSAQQVTTDPASTHIFPAGGRRGSLVDVRIGGECLPPRTRLRFFGEGISAPALLEERASEDFAPSPRRKPGESPMNYPREWRSHIEISANAEPGARLWRLSCARGGTGGRPFIVGDLPEFIEAEPNSLANIAQRVDLPVTINGQIAGERDLDYFCFDANAGDIVRADVVAARLGSPLEPVVECFAPDGRRVAAEEIRVGADPVLAFRAPTSGQYRLLVANLGFRGDPSHVYRITLSTAPYICSAFPPCGLVGSSQPVELLALTGEGPPRVFREIIDFPMKPGEFRWAAASLGMNAVPLMASDLPLAVETAGNDTRESATELSWPAVAAGRFESAADEDWYRLTCRQDTLLSIECSAAPPGSTALPIVTLTDGNGGPLAQASAVQDPRNVARIEWRAPVDGHAWLRVRDLRHGVRGGDALVYLLAIRAAAPDFLLSTKVDFANVVQGGRSEVDVSVQRRGGFTGPIELSADGLPAGVRLENNVIAAGQPAVKLALVAAAEAPSCDVTLRIKGRAEVQAGAGIVERPASAAHWGHDADGVAVDCTSVDHLQLTVVHKPVFRLYCNEAYQYAHRGTIHPYFMEIERLDGFNGPITLQVADRQIKDLDGIEIIETTVPAGDSQVLLPIYLPETMHINVQAHSNVYAQGHVEFVDKFGERQTQLVVSTMRCMVRTLPTVVKLRAVEVDFVVRRGATVPCRLKLDRTPNFNGAMQVELMESANSGFSCRPMQIAAGESGVTVMLDVSSEADAPLNRSLKFRAVGMMDDVRVISEVTLPVKVVD